MKRSHGLVLSLVLVGFAIGCASSAPFDQRFVEVRTPHFEIVSSFGDEATRVLARELETFYAGVTFAVGIPRTTEALRPTRVIAFDGRGLVRPFAIRGEAAYLLSTLEGPVLVLRAAGSLATRFDSELRHQYGHHILRSASKERPPLWYEEGRAQIAGSVEVRGSVAQIGRIPGERADEMLAWRNTKIAEVFAIRDLRARTLAQRRSFASECWAIVHTILFGGSDKQVGPASLDRVRRAFESGDAARLRKVTEALDGGGGLAGRVYDHLAMERHRTERLQVVGLEKGTLSPRPVSTAKARVLLGGLAASLDRPEVAFEYFDRAYDRAPGDASVVAGRIWALARAGETVEARDALIASAVESAAGMGDARQRRGLAWLEVALRESDPSAKRASLNFARDEFLAALEFQRQSIAARAGLGRVALLDGSGPEAALAEFEAAAEEAPGLLEIDLLIAEAEASRGGTQAARRRIASVLSRSHDPLLTRRARAMSDSID